MLYHYIVSDKTGRMIEGDMEADNVNRVLQYCASNNLRPVNIYAVRDSKRGLLGYFFGKITIADKVFLTRYLSLMLKVGTDLLSSINILIADFEKPSVKNFLLEVKTNLSRGQPFYQTFARHPESFSPTFINLVKAAELSGNLQKTFEDLSESLQKEADLRRRVQSAFIYPIILSFVALCIFSFLAFFALPRLAHVFLESGIDPPAFSKVIFTLGLFFGNHVLGFLTGIVLVVGFCTYFFFKNEVGRRFASNMLSHMPIVRTVYRDLAIQQFASTFSSLMKAGMPIVQTIKITSEVVGLEEFRASLRNIADEGLLKGLTVGEAFHRESVFPVVLVNLIAISEKAGHLQEVLETVADFYSAKVDVSIKSMVTFLEPILLLIMGVVVGVIAMAIIIPIYQLTSQF